MSLHYPYFMAHNVVRYSIIFLYYSDGAGLSSVVSVLNVEFTVVLYAVQLIFTVLYASFTIFGNFYNVLQALQCISLVQPLVLVNLDSLSLSLSL